MQDKKLPRRTVLKAALAGLAAIPVVAAWTRADAAAPLPKLEPADALAKSLGYVPDSTKVDAKANPTYKPDQKCSNCLQYKGAAGDGSGPCVLFPLKSVEANGWCKVWAKKA